MVQVEMIDTNNKKQVDQFVKFHYDLYKNCPQWVPPFIADVKMMLNRKKHPFYEHSDADFFIALRDGKMVGRIAAMENKPYNQCHNSKQAVFYLFDSIDDQEVAAALFDAAASWARKRGLNKIVGPKGFSAFDGYGIQILGHELRQMMNMMNYNYPYYQKLVETYGFEKEVDFVSCYISASAFKLPDRIHELVSRVKERNSFEVKEFKSKKELIKWAWKIGQAYNNTFINNWEYYPFTQSEIKFIVDNLMTVADPRLIKIITKNDEVVGFMLGFYDVSEAMQRHSGHLTPWAILDLLITMKRTKWISLNGVGVLPQYQGRGGNYLMMEEMAKTIQQFAQFTDGELTQVAESAVQMRKDLENVGGKAYKNHRVYHIDI
jgi:GNAT superfamily N-acetyltransferase